MHRRERKATARRRKGDKAHHHTQEPPTKILGALLHILQEHHFLPHHAAEIAVCGDGRVTAVSKEGTEDPLNLALGRLPDSQSR